jgi:hypothetical protein
MASVYSFKCKQCGLYQQEELITDKRLKWYCNNCKSFNLYIDYKAIEETIKKEGGIHDPVNHPTHYTNHPSGIECIQITEHMNFCLGNAVKYIWRASLKNGLEDLEKASWYINREIERLKSKEK